MNQRTPQVVDAVVAGLLSACSSAAETPARTEASVASTSASWDCIQALSATALSTGSTVRRARLNLTELISDPLSTEKAVVYFQTLVDAISDKDEDDLIGDALEAVSCDSL